MIKTLLSGAAAAALLTGCASSSMMYKAPEVQAYQTQSAQLDTAPIPTYYRSDAENKQMLGSIFNRLKGAAQPICRDSGVDCTRFVMAYNPSDVKNAYASEGYKITMFAGLLKHMSEPEAAAVVAHEMSHLIGKHNQETQQRAGVGATLGGLAAMGVAVLAGGGGQAAQIAGKLGQGAGQMVAVRAYSKDQEREADYVGAYILKNAGYDLNQAGKVWSTLSKLSKNPGSKESSGMFSTHPSNAERTVAWDQTVREVQQSRTGLPKKNMGPN